MHKYKMSSCYLYFCVVFGRPNCVAPFGPFFFWNTLNLYLCLSCSLLPLFGLITSQRCGAYSLRIKLAAHLLQFSVVFKRNG